MKSNSNILDALAAKSEAVRKQVYDEAKSHREILLDRLYEERPKSALAIATQVAKMTDVEVLEKLNYGREPIR